MIIGGPIGLIVSPAGVVIGGIIGAAIGTQAMKVLKQVTEEERKIMAT